MRTERILARPLPKGPVVALALALAFLGTYGAGRLGRLAGLDSWGLVAAVTLGTLLAHEALHALAARCYGARPRLGLGWLWAYTTFDELLPRDRYLVTVLTPLVALGAVSLGLFAAWPAARGPAVLALVVNTTGAAGDLWTAAALLRVPRDARVRDTIAGFEAYPAAPGCGENPQMV